MYTLKLSEFSWYKHCVSQVTAHISWLWSFHEWQYHHRLKRLMTPYSGQVDHLHMIYDDTFFAVKEIKCKVKYRCTDEISFYILYSNLLASIHTSSWCDLHYTTAYSSCRHWHVFSLHSLWGEMLLLHILYCAELGASDMSPRLKIDTACMYLF